MEKLKSYYGKPKKNWLSEEERKPIIVDGGDLRVLSEEQSAEPDVDRRETYGPRE